MSSESIFNLFQNVEPISSEQKEEYCVSFKAFEPFQPGVTKPWYDIMDVAGAVVVTITGLSMFWHKNLRTHP